MGERGNDPKLPSSSHTPSHLLEVPDNQSHLALDHQHNTIMELKMVACEACLPRKRTTQCHATRACRTSGPRTTSSRRRLVATDASLSLIGSTSGANLQMMRTSESYLKRLAQFTRCSLRTKTPTARCPATIGETR